MPEPEDDFRPYPSPVITPGEFEDWLGEVLPPAFPPDAVIEIRESLSGVDGSYVLDVTVRFRAGGLDFLVIGEAKHHTRPVEREDALVLNAKLQSLGAHKGVIFSTSGFQKGAIDFARVHGIALVMVTEGRFTYLMRSQDPPAISREYAREVGLPDFVGYRVLGDASGSISSSLVSPDRPDVLADLGTKNPPASSASPEGGL
jgi:hypothetical protein